jgi:hypothetical protein
MIKPYALSGLGIALSGCAMPTKTWKGNVEWPDERSAKNVVESLEAGAVLAAAGAIHELVRNNSDPRLFRGCSSPEQGLEVSIFTGPTPGLYYLILDQRFDRCGGAGRDRPAQPGLQRHGRAAASPVEEGPRVLRVAADDRGRGWGCCRPSSPSLLATKRDLEQRRSSRH